MSYASVGVVEHVHKRSTLIKANTDQRKPISNHIIWVSDTDSTDIRQTNAFTYISVVQLESYWGNNSFFNVSRKCTDWQTSVCHKSTSVVVLVTQAWRACQS